MILITGILRNRDTKVIRIGFPLIELLVSYNKQFFPKFLLSQGIDLLTTLLFDKICIMLSK